VAGNPGPFRAVIFDLGGVVMPSPLGAFRDYEARHGLPHRFLSEVVVGGGDDGAWSRFERGELTLDTFAAAFEQECASAGGTVVTADLLAEIHTGSGPHPAMVAAIGAIRARGLQTAALTNNWPDTGSDTGRSSARRASFAELFDVVVESAVEGLRKPDVRIYELTCARLAVTPPEAVFLDDLGTNLKPARAMGMTTIKVDEPGAALVELEQILGFALGGPAWS
jgi:epoxide hydrolase-like predicted phosphatase